MTRPGLCRNEKKKAEVVAVEESANIWYDGRRFMLPRSEHTGDNLRAFFGVPTSKDLFVEMDEGDDVLIEGDKPYFVDERDKFYSVSRKINQ
jgi:hypothetical protein